MHEHVQRSDWKKKRLYSAFNFFSIDRMCRKNPNADVTVQLFYVFQIQNIPNQSDADQYCSLSKIVSIDDLWSFHSTLDWLLSEGLSDCYTFLIAFTPTSIGQQ